MELWGNNVTVGHRRRFGPILLIVFAGLLISSLFPFSNGAWANPDVFANPEEVRYEGSGGLILPNTVNSGTRNEVIRCRGCGWKLTAACVPGPENYCDAGIRGCPGLIDHLRVWFRPLGGEWKEVDRICLTNYQVTTVAELESRLAESFERYVPEQVARCWPEQGAVTNLPLICQSGQPPEGITWSIPVAGFHVTIRTSPTWTWNFEGRPLLTRNAGGPFPNRSISHTYLAAGAKNIKITTRWNGNFSVDSLESIEIERELIQTSSILLTVGQAKARLRCPGVPLC